MTKEALIMNMVTGTKIKNKRSGAIYVLGNYINPNAREIYDIQYSGIKDYINNNTQEEYEEVEE